MELDDPELDLMLGDMALGDRGFTDAVVGDGLCDRTANRSSEIVSYDGLGAPKTVASFSNLGLIGLSLLRSTGLLCTVVAVLSIGENIVPFI